MGMLRIGDEFIRLSYIESIQKIYTRYKYAIGVILRDGRAIDIFFDSKEDRDDEMYTLRDRIENLTNEELK